jgi:hypothetical protein
MESEALHLHVPMTRSRTVESLDFSDAKAQHFSIFHKVILSGSIGSQSSVAENIDGSALLEIGFAACVWWGQALT